MKVSFLVTYYQQQEYVKRSLDSILALRKPGDWEVLIGDDGSSDGTVDMIKPYLEQDPAHFKLWIMERDPDETYDPVQRASANRIHLLEQATGDCFCVLDGDDFYSDTEFVALAVDQLEAFPEIALVAFDYWEYRESGVAGVKNSDSRKADRIDRHRYIRSLYTPAGACVHRRNPQSEELEALRAWGTFDDNDIVLYTLKRGGMVWIHRPVYAYRQTGNSVYGRMQHIEKAALNLVGMGVDLRMMGSAWENDLKARYATAVMTLYYGRKNVRSDLGEKTFSRYLEAVRRCSFTQGEQLLCYDSLSPEKQVSIKKWVRQVAGESPLRAVYAWYLTHIRRR